MDHDFDFTFSAPPEHVADLPAETGVAVIGGGIIGVMTAWYLHQMGARVVLLEKGRIACEQSSRNWGWVRQQGRDPAELPIMVEAMDLWRTLADELGDGLGFRQRGILYLASSQKEMDEYQASLAHARACGVDTRLISGAEVARMLPGAGPGWKGALYTASDARAEPWQAVPLIARALAAKGVTIRERCAVRALDIAAGRVRGIITEAGPLRAGCVVLAGGAWSSLFLRNHGVSIPQLSVRATAGATGPVGHEIFAGAAEGAGLAFRRRADGGYTLAPGFHHQLYIGPDALRNLPKYLGLLAERPLGTRYRPAAPPGFPDAWTTPRRWPSDRATPFEAMRVLNPPPDRRKAGQLAAGFARLYPGVGPVRLRHAWAGMIDLMPDELPIVGEVPALPGLVLATGMSGHGFGIGPGMGRVVADLALGRAARHDLGPFRFDRFRR